MGMKSIVHVFMVVLQNKVFLGELFYLLEELFIYFLHLFYFLLEGFCFVGTCRNRTLLLESFTNLIFHYFFLLIDVQLQFLLQMNDPLFFEQIFESLVFQWFFNKR
jgi:hypothetical protein